MYYKITKTAESNMYKSKKSRTQNSEPGLQQL